VIAEPGPVRSQSIGADDAAVELRDERAVRRIRPRGPRFLERRVGRVAVRIAAGDHGLEQRPYLVELSRADLPDDEVAHGASAASAGASATRPRSEFDSASVIVTSTKLPIMRGSPAKLT